jgi:HEAT repeat protein
MSAIYAIEKIGPIAPEAARALIGALSDENIDVQGASILALSRFGGEPGVVPALIDMFDREDSYLRYCVAISLGLIGPEAREAIPDLIECLNDEDSLVRSSAAESLGLIGHNTMRAVNALIKAIDDVDELVRRSAAYALGQVDCGSVEATEALISALDDDHNYVRRSAINALGSIRANASQAVPAIVEALDDSDADVRRAAVVSLGKFGADAASAVPKLKALLYEERNLYIPVNYALFMIGDRPDARLESMLEYLRSCNKNARYQVAFYIGEIGPQAKDAVPALIEMLNGEGALPNAAALALGKIGPDAALALPKLREMADDYKVSSYIRKTIRETIAKIEGA